MAGSGPTGSSDDWQQSRHGLWRPAGWTEVDGGDQNDDASGPEPNTRDDASRTVLAQTIAAIVAAVVAVATFVMTVYPRPFETDSASSTSSSTPDAPTTQLTTPSSSSIDGLTTVTVAAAISTTEERTTTDSPSETARRPEADIVTIERLVAADVERLPEFEGRWVSMLAVWCYERKVDNPSNAECPPLGQTASATGILNDLERWQTQTDGVVASNSNSASDFGFSSDTETVYFFFDDRSFETRTEAAAWCAGLDNVDPTINRYGCAPWLVE